MAPVLEIAIDVIVHSTEDSSKFFDAFDEFFALGREAFSSASATGHYENPIVIISARLKKRQACEFWERLMEMTSTLQKNAMIEEIPERTVGSKFHLRLDKQEFLAGRIAFSEKDAVRIRIHTPIYNKRDAAASFTKIFQATD